MKQALALALLLALGAEGQNYRRPKDRVRRGAPVALRVLPAGGGQSSLIGLCAATDLLGFARTFGVDGTGAACSGSVAVTSVGSPATLTQALCPNGANCSAVTRQRLASTDQFQSTAGFTQGATDLWACSFHAADANVGGFANFTQGLNGASASNYVFIIEHNSASSETVYVSNGTTSTSLSSNALPPVARAPMLHCLTYHWVTSGTSVLKNYVNGALANTSSTAVGPLNTTALKFSVNGYSGGGNSEAMQMFGAAAGTGLPSDTQMSQLASAVLGTLSGSGGETATFTRASAQTCLSDDGTALSMLPNGRPCVSRGLYLSERAQTNLLLRSEDLANAAWTVVGTSVVTADTWAAPDGTATGDTLTDDDGASKEGVRQVVAASAQDKYTLSCFMQSGTATSAQLVITGTGNAAGDTTCSFSGAPGANGLGNGCSTGGLDSTTRRKCCTTTAAYGAALTNIEGKVTVGTVVGDTGSVKVWGCQLEDDDNGRAYATSYVPTTSSSATRATTALTFPLPATSKPISLSVRTVPYGFRTAFNQRLELVSKDGSNVVDFYEQFTTGLVLCDFDVGGVFSGGTSTVALTANAMNTASCSYDGTNVRVCANGACNSTARSFTPWSAPVTLYAGSWSSVNYELDGWVGAWCVADSQEGCGQ